MSSTTVEKKKIYMYINKYMFLHTYMCVYIYTVKKMYKSFRKETTSSTLPLEAGTTFLEAASTPSHVAHKPEWSYQLGP